ncbi:Gfo/Idh/MocA family protein [Hoeflea prorocentri]|uniref:Gfo/Idh/MocA family oxidoreductase n=1 Tax=Hoeflea prorocentri TaxID=1922333 RepID=A0A9X3UIC7_9HYPH|nr:Gfo/Idh/MocA family oxidoreductase [Hoeflea prorocentri]MCY6381146.1 Gfo/Idh/MocA family oxidoreductase [Hoeflea prorocentri]MDA5398946.1 Gfo/Idh/MocA family oxidoreductase [Hoeflea prorocentri]
MSFKSPIKVVCQGAGYFSRFHYDAWQRIADALPVASVNRDIEKAKATGLAAYDNLEQALDDHAPDLLDIITPPETHLDTIRRATAKGVRVIICQKPFCRDLEEAKEAVAIAKQAETILVVHENFRFQPWYRLMREEIENGRIGTLLQLTFRLRTGDGQGENAYLDRQPYFQTMPRLLIHETGVHFIDVFRYMLGEPDTIYADLRRHNPVIAGEDAGHFIMGFADGSRAVFDGNRLLDHNAENHRVTLGEAAAEGTDGTLFLDGAGAVRFRRFGAQEEEILLEPQQYQGFGGDCVHALQKHVIQGLISGTPIENLAEDYLRNIKLVEAVYRSNETGKRINL